jgi:hypothetical protein
MFLRIENETESSTAMSQAEKNNMPFETHHIASENRPVFSMNLQNRNSYLVEITWWEDHGDFWYVGWIPVDRLNGCFLDKSRNLGPFGATRFYKNRPNGDTFVRLHNVFARDVPAYGYGQRGAFTKT